MPIWIRLIKFTKEGLALVQKDQASILANMTQVIEEKGGKLRVAFAALAPFDLISIVECKDEAQLKSIDTAVAKHGLYTVENYSAIPIAEFISTINTSPIFLEAWLKARDQLHPPASGPGSKPSRGKK
jgi:uncharacterized protein with GYD domain